MEHQLVSTTQRDTEKVPIRLLSISMVVAGATVLTTYLSQMTATIALSLILALVLRLSQTLGPNNLHMATGTFQGTTTTISTFTTGIDSSLYIVMARVTRDI